MVLRNEIETCFALELLWIHDQELRNKVIDVWLRASDNGGWKKLDDVPFTLLFENSGRLTEHTRRVTKLAKCIKDQREELINQDFLISGALLHDVGKMLEYVEKDGRVVKSEYGKKFRGKCK